MLRVMKVKRKLDEVMKINTPQVWKDGTLKKFRRFLQRKELLKYPEQEDFQLFDNLF